jgi:hypothetical protein
VTFSLFLQRNFKEQIQVIRNRMKEVLEVHFQQELEKFVREMEDNFRPYTQFITKQQQHADLTKSRLQTITKRLLDISNLLDVTFEK